MKDLPKFDAPLLTQFAEQCSTRSKAITYSAPGWKITRDATDDTSERLNIDADGHHGQLRLSLWDDVMLQRIRHQRRGPENAALHIFISPGDHQGAVWVRA